MYFIPGLKVPYNSTQHNLIYVWTVLYLTKPCNYYPSKRPKHMKTKPNLPIHELLNKCLHFFTFFVSASQISEVVIYYRGAIHCSGVSTNFYIHWCRKVAAYLLCLSKVDINSIYCIPYKSQSLFKVVFDLFVPLWFHEVFSNLSVMSRV